MRPGQARFHEDGGEGKEKERKRTGGKDRRREGQEENKGKRTCGIEETTRPGQARFHADGRDGKGKGRGEGKDRKK